MTMFDLDKGGGHVGCSERRGFYVRAVAMVGAFLAPGLLLGQLDQTCTVSVLNRNIQVNSNGTWVLPNVPANQGRVRARATCVLSGLTRFGQSALFTVPLN